MRPASGHAPPDATAASGHAPLGATAQCVQFAVLASGCAVTLALVLLDLQQKGDAELRQLGVSACVLGEHRPSSAAAADADTGEMDAVDKADEALFDLLQRLHKGSTKVLPARDAPGKPRKKPA